MEKRHDIIERVLRLSRMTRREIYHGRGKLGARRVLAALAKEDGIRAADLAERLDIRPSSLTEVLKKAEEDGLVLRTKDEKDSRVARIFITEKARDRLAQHSEAQAEWEQLIGECLTEEEIAAFCSISDKLADFLEQKLPGERGRGRGNPHYDRRGGEN